MQTRVFLFFTPLLGLLCSAAEGRAGMISWTADWSQSNDVIRANGGAESGGITLASPVVTVLTGNNLISAATLTTFTSATSSNPDLFNAAPYTLKVKLTDLASNDTGALTFTGSITGSQTNMSATFSNHYNSPITESMKIGANDYTVTLTSFMAPGPAPMPGGTPIIGDFMAQVNVQAAGGSVGAGGGSGSGSGSGSGGGSGSNGKGPPLSTPEPTSLILAGLAGMFGLYRWRQWAPLPAGL
jgi:hypothetical protein